MLRLPAAASAAAFRPALARPGAMPITLIILWLYLASSSQMHMPYEMCEHYLRWNQGNKTSIYIEYKDILHLQMVRRQFMIEVKTRLHSIPVFVPEEDYDYVRNYIMSRTPGSVEFLYQ